MFDETMNKGQIQEDRVEKLNRVLTNARYATSECMLSFDDMAYLAEHAPEELEAFRKRICGEVIASAPESVRPRLEGLQFVVDMERKRSHSNLDACIRISRMMHESLHDLSKALNDPQGYMEAKRSASAAIVPFTNKAAV